MITREPATEEIETKEVAAIEEKKTKGLEKAAGNKGLRNK